MIKYVNFLNLRFFNNFEMSCDYSNASTARNNND